MFLNCFWYQEINVFTNCDYSNWISARQNASFCGPPTNIMFEIFHDIRNIIIAVAQEM